MASHDIAIRLSVTGSREVEQAFGQVAESGSKAEKALGDFSQAAQTTGGAVQSMLAPLRAAHTALDTTGGAVSGAIRGIAHGVDPLARAILDVQTIKGAFSRGDQELLTTQEQLGDRLVRTTEHMVLLRGATQVLTAAGAESAAGWLVTAARINLVAGALVSLGLAAADAVEKSRAAEQRGIELRTGLWRTYYASGQTTADLRGLESETYRNTPGISLESIQQGTEALLEFRNIAGATFREVYQTAAQFSQATGTDFVQSLRARRRCRTR